MKNYFAYPKSEDFLKLGFEFSDYRKKNIVNVSEHSHDFYEIYFLKKGNVKYTILSDLYELKQNSVIIISPKTSHKTTLLMKDYIYVRAVLWVKKNIVEDFAFNSIKTNQPIYLNNANAETLNILFLLIKREQENLEKIESTQNDYAISLIFSALKFLSLCDKTKGESNFVEQVYEYVAVNISKPFSLDDLSSSLYLSKYYLSHKFKNETGITIYDYSTNQKMLLAKKLIKQGFPIKIISEKCGYKDYTSFYKAFKKKYNLSPQMFIKKMKGSF